MGTLQEVIHFSHYNTVYLAVNKFRKFCVFNKFAKFNLHKNCIFIKMGVAHECLSMKDGRLNEVIEYS